ncbi:HD domain-containing protein [Candidatus Saccharibacteria bacterium]|nr:HD domain-containing protein [Candidatus Saccharibacteria bacterium]
MDILYDYQWIMQREAKLYYMKSYQPDNRFSHTTNPLDIQNVAYRILEIAYNSTIMRAGNVVGHLTNSLLSYESDGAHTNLVRSLVKYAMDDTYGWGNHSPRYDRSEIDEAATIHDLAENETGDIPDNRNRDEVKKLQHENNYFNTFLAAYNPSMVHHSANIEQLLHEMQDKTSPEGRMLYTADKASAIIMMLTYDKIGLCPKVYPGEPTIAKISPFEIAMCTKQPDGSMLLSELWTLDYLYGRKLIQFDDTGFFTAIIVMATLIVHEDWYTWRENHYD